MTLHDTGSTDHYTATRFPVEAVLNVSSNRASDSVFNCSSFSPKNVTFNYVNGGPGLGNPSRIGSGIKTLGSGITVSPVTSTPINPFKDYPSGQIIEADSREVNMGDIIVDFGYIGNRSVQLWNTATFCVYTSNDGENWERQHIKDGVGGGNTLHTLLTSIKARYLGMGGTSAWSNRYLNQIKKLKY